MEQQYEPGKRGYSISGPVRPNRGKCTPVGRGSDRGRFCNFHFFVYWLSCLISNTTLLLELQGGGPTTKKIMPPGKT